VSLAQPAGVPLHIAHGDALRRLRIVVAAGLGLALMGVAAAMLPAAPSPAMVIAGGVGLLSVLALAMARYDAAVALGIFLLGVVKIEPAPPDAVFAVVIAVAFVTGRFDLRRVPIVASTTVGVFIALNLLSGVDAVSGSVAARFFAITLYLAVFSLWFASYVNSPGRARLTVVAYLAIAVVSAVLGAAALNLPLPGRTLFIGNGSTRANGLFKDANVFGPFLIPIMVILLEERFRPRLLRLAPRTNALLLGVLGVGVLFSYSRAAWLNLAFATVVTLTVMVLRRGGGRRALRLLAALLIAAALATAAAELTGSVSFIAQRAQVQTYDSERFGAQRAGIELVQRHPVGVGPGQFLFHYPVETHSTYVRVLVEQGYLGLLTWLVLSIATLVMALRNAVIGRDTYGIGSAALLGAWCGIMLNSAVVDTLHWRHLWLVAALIWAGTMRRSALSRAAARSPSRAT
jgi:O-antigen ligase